MKKIAAMAVLSLSLSLPALSFAQNGAGNGGGNQPPMQQMGMGHGMQGGKKRWGGKMKFPAIRRSLMMLKRTRMVLQHGRPVFGGHRAQAIEAVNQAIAQCKAALQYARTHHPKHK